MGIKGNFGVEFSVSENGRKAPNWTIDSDIGGELSLEALLKFTKANLLLIADQALSEEQAKGFDKNPVVHVDGKLNKPLIQVHPLGKIEFTKRQQLSEVLRFVYDGILSRAPVKTGLYKKSNFVFVNGRQVASDKASFESWLAKNPQVEAKDIIRFVNIQPYARKLERYGVTAQKKKYRTRKSKDARGRSGNSLGEVLAPNGAYFLTTRSAARIYKNNLQILFKYIPGSDFGFSAKFKTPSKGIVASKGKRKGKALGHKGARTYLYPSILLKIRETGLK